MPATNKKSYQIQKGYINIYFLLKIKWKKPIFFQNLIYASKSRFVSKYNIYNIFWKLKSTSVLNYLANHKLKENIIIEYSFKL